MSGLSAIDTIALPARPAAPLCASHVDHPDKKASYDYTIGGAVERALSAGWEVKAIRRQAAHLKEAYVIVARRRTVAAPMRTSRHEDRIDHFTPEPTRTRKLLFVPMRSAN